MSCWSWEIGDREHWDSNREEGHKSQNSWEWDMEVMGLGEWAQRGQAQQGQGWWYGNGDEVGNTGAGEWGLL